MLKNFYQLLLKPKIRYSKIFSRIRSALELKDREKLIKNAMHFVGRCRIPGDYLEFGVWKGESFICAYKEAGRWAQLNSMHFYAFDSFQGLPKSSKDYDSDEFKKGEFHCSLPDFVNNLAKAGVDPNRVTSVEGWFEKTLNKKTKEKLPIKHAAVVFIDCDLYEPTKYVLNFVKDYLADGSIIVFDDWFCHKGRPDKGEQKAFWEWLEKNPDISVSEFYKVGGVINSFLVHV